MAARVQGGRFWGLGHERGLAADWMPDEHSLRRAELVAKPDCVNEVSEPKHPSEAALKHMNIHDGHVRRCY